MSRFQPGPRWQSSVSFEACGRRTICCRYLPQTIVSAAHKVLGQIIFPNIHRTIAGTASEDKTAKSHGVTAGELAVREHLLTCPGHQIATQSDIVPQSRTARWRRRGHDRARRIPGFYVRKDTLTDAGTRFGQQVTWQASRPVGTRGINLKGSRFLPWKIVHLARNGRAKWSPLNSQSTGPRQALNQMLI